MKDNKIPVSQEIKKHLLTGISWMIPLIVAAGICIALGQVLGGTDVSEKTGTIPWMLNQIGGWGMGLIVPLISAAIAYSGNDSNLLIVFYVQIMPDDFVMQLHRF